MQSLPTILCFWEIFHTQKVECIHLQHLFLLIALMQIDLIFTKYLHTVSFFRGQLKLKYCTFLLFKKHLLRLLNSEYIFMVCIDDKQHLANELAFTRITNRVNDNWRTEGQIVNFMQSPYENRQNLDKITNTTYITHVK